MAKFGHCVPRRRHCGNRRSLLPRPVVALHLGAAWWLVALVLLSNNAVHGESSSSASTTTASSSSSCQEIPPTPPYVPLPSTWLPSSLDISNIPTKDVYSYLYYHPPVSSSEDNNHSLCTPQTLGTIIADDDDGGSKTTKFLEPHVIGQMPQFSTDDALHVLEQAVTGWKGGSGVWTSQYTLRQRMDAIRQVFDELQDRRQDIVNVLMWEIGKNRQDAESEFDRTIQFGEMLLDTLEKHQEFVGEWKELGNTVAFVKRHAIGIILALAPYNYPINESYATILPALLLGNIVIVKIPTVGGLAHLLTFQAFASVLPPNTIHFVSGSGRKTLPPLMETGEIDGLAFIGGSNAADDLIHTHPNPHRLKVFLQLEAKNMGVVLDDAFDNNDLFEHALQETILGTLSYNGQRCTALKLVFVPAARADVFVDHLVERLEGQTTIGLPWQLQNNNKYSMVTPLPNPQRVQAMQELLQDALDKGAKIRNRNGGKLVGGESGTLFIPAVVYPVTPDMALYHVEQFGPLIPVAKYDTLDTVLEYGQLGEYAQQVSLFGADVNKVTTLVDRFAAVFGKINLNGQAGRSPDTLPFSGRRSSAMGVMSVEDSLREFSVPTVLAYKKNKNVNNQEIVDAWRHGKPSSVFVGSIATPPSDDNNAAAEL